MALCSDRVERKERARLKTVKFNAKPGSLDSKGVSGCMGAKWLLLASGFTAQLIYDILVNLDNASVINLFIDSKVTMRR